ncbi:MAG TPA: sugar phosphate isomerase/epimerase family protein [Candidatus Hydrogenedentes bacterium]|nr:sugar phosphate isomerase/epimerase family protein [Candidatus Hydrogenedentota bacterium]HPG68813.1 sugar phosphate isomerase/epimerase family protein [Candidatus Hydrogenedentota bacterium]
MKLSVQEGMLPGRCLEEKLDRAAALGFDGIELGGGGLRNGFDTVQRALAGHSVRVSTICSGYRGCLLDADKAQRDLAVTDIEVLLQAGGALGAVGLITVPLFGGPRLPDLSPLRNVGDLETDLLVEILGPLGETAQQAGCLVLVEPLNRYETHLINRLSQAVDVVRRAGAKGLAIMADLFHMSIEEDDMAQAVRAAGKRIRHVHLADSQRWQPGTGHTDFGAVFRALRDVGFRDYMALECGLRGRPGTALANAVTFLKEHMG